MLPDLSITTLPCVGPMTDFPSSPSPQPGTVSKVIKPQPILTGWAFSAAKTGKTVPNTTAKAMENNRLFMLWIPVCWLAGIARLFYQVPGIRQLPAVFSTPRPRSNNILDGLSGKHEMADRLKAMSQTRVRPLVLQLQHLYCELQDSSE